MLTLKDLSFGVASGCAEYYVFRLCLKLCLIGEFRSLEYRARVLSFVSVNAGAGLLHAESLASDVVNFMVPDGITVRTPNPHIALSTSTSP